MHILTGFLLAGLLGKNKFRRRTLMPMLRTGPVQTAHFVPGRVRLRVPSLAENAAGAARCEQKLPTIEGVRSVRLDPATGSVLIVYREGEVRPELLFAAVVRLMNLDAEMKRMPQPVVTRELREILGSVNRMVYDRTRRVGRSLVGGAHCVGRRRLPKTVDAGRARLSGGAHPGLVGLGLAVGRPAVVVA